MLGDGVRRALRQPGRAVDRVQDGQAAEIRERFEQLKFAVNMAAPTLPQRAIARVLRDGSYDHHLRTLRGRLREIVERVSAAVAESFPAVSW